MHFRVKSMLNRIQLIDVTIAPNLLGYQTKIIASKLGKSFVLKQGLGCNCQALLKYFRDFRE
jgi:hypothetical protein